MIYKILIIFLFFVNAFLYFYRANVPELRGDETAAYISLMPSFHKLIWGEIYPSFLVFYHEPIQLLIQIPVVIFGASEFWARLPNILSGIISFVVLYKLSTLLFKNQLYVFVTLAIYTLNASFLVYRLTLAFGVFTLLLLTFAYFYFHFQSTQNIRSARRSLIALFTAIFTFVDGLFVLPGLLASTYLWPNPTVRKLAIKLVVITVSVLSAWFITTFLASIISGLFDWKLVAPARLFFRGSHYALDAFVKNWEALSDYIHPSLLMFVLLLLPFSFKDQWAKKLWVLFLIPLLFFNIVQNPTQHMFNFWPVIILLSVFGLKHLLEKSSYLKTVMLAILSACLILSTQHLFSKVNSLNMANYKIAGSFVQSQTPTCQPIYTNIDGYTFRFYFNRPYTNHFTENFSYAVVEKSPSLVRQLKNLGYNSLAMVPSRQGALIILKNGSVNKQVFPNKIINHYYEYFEVLDYVTKCNK